MRRVLLFISAIVILYSCNNGSSADAVSDTSISRKREPVATNVNRSTIIDELKRLKEIYSSKDKEKIATIFDFPIADTTASFYMEEDAYYKELKENGDKATRDMFIRYFPQIYESVQMDDIIALFKQIPLDSLHEKDELEKELIIKTEPCYKNYKIEIENEIVTLSINGKSNHNFQSSKTKEAEIPENSSEFCEHSLWWKFKLDGKKLHLIQIAGAD